MVNLCNIKFSVGFASGAGKHQFKKLYARSTETVFERETN
jgi:hypothetical protein